MVDEVEDEETMKQAEQTVRQSQLQLPAFRPARLSRPAPLQPDTAADAVPMDIDSELDMCAQPPPILPQLQLHAPQAPAAASPPNAAISLPLAAAPAAAQVIVIGDNEPLKDGNGLVGSVDAAAKVASSFAARKRMMAAARMAGAATAAPAATGASSFIPPLNDSSASALPRCVPWRPSITARRRMRQQQKQTSGCTVASVPRSLGKRLSASAPPLALRVSEVLDDDIALLKAVRKPAEVVDLTDEMDQPGPLPPPSPPAEARGPQQTCPTAA